MYYIIFIQEQLNYLNTASLSCFKPRGLIRKAALNTDLETF